MENRDEVIRKLSEIVREAERMQNTYWWNTPTSASGRRSYEKKHSHEKITWTENGSEWTASYTVVCTCSYIKASGDYTRDGRKTTLTAIRSSLNRMTA